MQASGSRAQVMHGTAAHTSGGLTKADLKYNRQGEIVSRRASAAAKANKNLGSALIPKGSHINPFGPTKKRRSTRRRKLVCHTGKSVHCGKTCIPVGAKCHM